ncbi:hypothetical protein RDWZM_002731 [Blomia tropicalis]|uniref:Phosphotransferase n=1 Tax=Blomia tropicalis TaxID=40697 RepID=A0A9Q0RSF7_BLOTA|nr:hypothetical protein RDWZM_002731 [Blomia tropicalis]
MKVSKYLLEESQFHHPKLILNDAKRQDEAIAIIDQFLLDRSQVARIQSIFTDELANGLSNSLERRRGNSLLMVNTFVPALQSIERETLAGDYISLDIGSSNFRVLYTKLCPGSNNTKEDHTDQDQFSVKYYEIPIEFRKGSSNKLFNFLAECIESFLREIPLCTKTNDTILPLGFTFSFPMNQLAIDVGQLKTWTKNYDLPDAVGQDVASLLQQSIESRGNPFNVRVVALLNDSTGTLVKGSYIDSDCAIGLIMGTGNNACYLEKVENIEKWQRTQRYNQVREILINMESGGFGDNGCIDFARTKYDRAVDDESLFPGSFTFEKYIGGHYLGEIFRHLLLDLTETGVIFNGNVSNQLKIKDSIKSEHLSSIEGDNTSNSVLELIDTLEYNRNKILDDDIAIIRYACSRITIRAATLLAALLSTLVIRMGRKRTVIAVDGSVYRKHPRIHQLMTDFINNLVDDHTKQIEIIEAEDGSGKGAGIVAALACKLKLYGQ